MGINTFAPLAADVESFIADELLWKTQKKLVFGQFGEQITLPDGRGRTYTATRFERLNLPEAPLVEGVPPTGDTLNISQVTGTMQQWAGNVNLTDVLEVSLKHPPLLQAVNLTAMQAAETIERNTINALLSGTQVMMSNGKAARVNLAATDVLTRADVNTVRTVLSSIGAFAFNGPTDEDMKDDIETSQQGASDSPAMADHYCAVFHPVTQADLRTDATVIAAWQYSDVNRLYNGDVGELDAVRFCTSNMIPSWTGVATVGSGTVGTAGNLATAANYYLQVTASDPYSQFETLIYQVSAAITTVVGPNGSITLTMPATAGYTYRVYIGTTASPVNLATTASGPITGSLQGQATKLAPSQTVVLTGIGVAMVPPAVPATGVTVYPTFVFGREAFAQITLRDIETTYLDKPDKSDPHNQQRVCGWKVDYATLIKDNKFMARVESGTARKATF